MVADQTELAQEQKYFDVAWEARERQRLGLGRAPSAAAHSGAQAAIWDYAQERLSRLKGADHEVAFGRIDTDEGERWYIGYNAIWNDESDVLVANWQAPVAAPFYEATPTDPQGLVRRRTYDCSANTILDFHDVVLAELAEDIARLQKEGVAAPERFGEDALLADLERVRTGEMQDIVRTIQAAQFGVIRADIDQLLVVQGGPGTGKTNVALHRVSWLLYNHRNRLSPKDFVVVGPSTTFIRYIKSVLPGLGDEDVRQADLASLVSGVSVGREETPGVSRLKGEPRITRLIERGLRDRIGVPDDALTVQVGTQVVAFDRVKIEGQLERLKSLRYTAGRQRLREYLREEVVRRAGEPPDREGQIDSIIDRIWPTLTPQAFLQELYGSEGRLLRAAGEDFTAAEVRLLYRRAAERLSEEVWSPADVPLLDYVDFVMNGPPSTRYAHIVVDEAQDLSPMELGMIVRRSARGSMTILGDLAQSTGAWARDSWDDVIEDLRLEMPVNVAELEFGYRVPKQVFEFAAQLLPYAAPGITPPKVVRPGPSDPKLVQTNLLERGDTIVDAAVEYLNMGYSVGVICPSELWDEVSGAFEIRGVRWSDARREGIVAPISLLRPLDVRGLEFDAVVVCEPEAIVREEHRGERLLYVALTRTTRFLTVVHVGAALPLPASGRKVPAAGPAAGDRADEEDRVKFIDDTRQRRMAHALAETLAEEIKASLQPAVWEEVVKEVAKLLQQHDAGNGDEGSPS